MERMRSTGGPQHPVSVADLLDRHGHVLEREPSADDPPPEPAGWLPRVLVAVGAVLVVGSVLGGVAVVSTTANDEPYEPVPGGLLDRLREPAGDTPPAAPTSTPALPDDPVAPAARRGPAPVPGQRAGSTARPGPGPTPAAPAPPVGVRDADDAGDRAPGGGAEAPPPASGGTERESPDPAPDESQPDTADQGPGPQTAADSEGGSGSGGLLGNVGKSVGGLLPG